MSEISRAAAILKALSTPARLELLATVLTRQEVGADTSVQSLAVEFDVPPKSLLKDIVRLQECGLLALHGHTVAADMTPLSSVADGLLAGLPVTRLLAEEPDLLRFFANGRLTTLPLDRRTRERVAGVLVRLIPAGRNLSEAEVNQMLNEVYDDHATLRRLMVDSGLLTRAGSADYRRVTAEPAGADSTPERTSTRTPAATAHAKNTP